MKITASLAIATTIGAAAAVFTGSPAQAVTSCTEHQVLEFQTPGFDTDMRARLCLSHGSPTRGAYAQVSWENGGDNATDGRRKFDSLVIHYRLRQGADIVVEGDCDLAGQVNLNETGLFTCPAAFHRSMQRGGWSTDGWLVYNVDRDGKGVMRIDLPATPVVEN